jgi:hypothetical protein
MMTKIVVKIPHKTRAHNVLFLSNSPFKQKKVALKTRYKRHEKHRKNTD